MTALLFMRILEITSSVYTGHTVYEPDYVRDSNYLLVILIIIIVIVTITIIIINNINDNKQCCQSCQ